MAEAIYKIPVMETLSAAWQKVYGAKATIWGAWVVVFLVVVGMIILGSVLSVAVPNIKSLVNFIIQGISFIMEMGLLYIGIRRAKNLPIEWTQFTRAFEIPIFIRLIGVFLLQIIVYLPFIILAMLPLIIFGIMMSQGNGADIEGPVEMSSGWKLLVNLTMIIAYLIILYLSIRMCLAGAFVLDRGVGSWNAIKLSFQATRSNVLRLLGIFILSILLFIISMIPILLGLIWTIPWLNILYGTVYARLSANVGL